MSDLPSGWAQCAVGDLVELVRGVSYDKAEVKAHVADGYIPVLRATNIDQVLNFDELVFVPERFVSRIQMLRAGDIVIAASSGSKSVVGKAAQLNDSWVGSFGAFCMGIRPVIASSAKYLGYFFQSPDYRLTASRLAAGSNINNLKREHVSDLKFKLPPEEEQGRIVEKLEELLSDLDAGIAALERARANLKRYRAAVLKAAVEGRLTEKWRAAHPDTEPAAKLLERILAERRKKWEEAQLKKFAEKKQAPPKGWKEKYAEPVKPDVAELPKLPEGWCWASLDQVAVEVRNGSARAPTSDASAYRILRINAVRPHSVDLEETRYVDVSDAEANEAAVRNGDLLFTRYNGSPALVGVAGLVRGLEGTILHPDKLIRVRVVENFLVEYLELACNVGSARAHIRRRTRTTAGQAGVSGADIRQIPVPLPPFVEIGQITTEAAQCLSLISASEKEIESGLSRAPRLRQSILMSAFQGRLVPQDPKDEPASELLARIRAARKAGGAEAKRGRQWAV